MAAKPLQLVNNIPTEVEATVSSAGSADAGKLPALDAAGKLDTTLMPTGIGADTASIAASENLTAGDFVNIYDDSGTPTCRKADPTTAGAARRADGFVLANVTSPANATVYFSGSNTQLSGLTAGTTYALSDATPGAVVTLANATTTTGESVQVLGRAISSTAMSVDIEEPIIRG